MVAWSRARKASGHRLQLDVGKAETVVGLGILMINLQGLAELNAGPAILTFIEIALATLQVFLFGKVGVAGTRTQQQQQSNHG